MTLRDFLSEVNKLVEERPEVLDFRVMKASDEEDNSYNLVYYEPTVGCYDEENGNFISEESYKELFMGLDQSNTVCLN
jgi:hypothetical protein